MVTFENGRIDSINKTCLIIIDGWGVLPPSTLPSIESLSSSSANDQYIQEEKDNQRGNAILQADTPVMNQLSREYPNTLLCAHGLSVGLPDGLMGNSEVGHLNIGAGRVVYQDIVRIDQMIEKKELEGVLSSFLPKSNDNNRMIHLVGLASDGGVHSHMCHLKALIEIMNKRKLDYRIHAITDGRDTSPAIAETFISQFDSDKIATIMGRYWAMDRDKRWERTRMAYEAMTMGIGEEIKVSSDFTFTPSDHLLQVIKEKREKFGETDEFIKPLIVIPSKRDKESNNKKENGIIGTNDTVIFFNFRSDRMRQLVQLFLDDSKDEGRTLISMTRYKSDFPLKVLSPPQTMINTLSEWISENGLKQFHCAETEKYAHVTFFFNGGREEAFTGEDRKLIESPKVATYDLKPEMSCIQVANEMSNAIRDSKRNGYSFVMCNLAPPDMVGHTGKLEETIKAVKATDNAIGLIWEACKEEGWILMITSDHGNAEVMIREGKAHTAHTTSPVPLIIYHPDKRMKEIKLKDEGSLCDVAPTVLELMGLKGPVEMTGKSLFPVNHEKIK